MCNNEHLTYITKQIATLAKSLLGDKLDSTILYGSYARGEQTEESDIDIMVLAKVSREQLQVLKNLLYH